jgi:hypothetical protein
MMPAHIALLTSMAATMEVILLNETVGVIGGSPKEVAPCEADANRIPANSFRKSNRRRN